MTDVCHMSCSECFCLYLYGRSLADSLLNTEHYQQESAESHLTRSLAFSLVSLHLPFTSH